VAHLKEEALKELVKGAYGKIAKGLIGCCCTCGPDPKQFAMSIGYGEEELKVIPPTANLGLSCGNPTAIADLREGEIVLDLGCGAGFDCFLAATKVGPKGRVIGVDMTPEMLERARENARNNCYDNVEFRLGEIENLPLEDNSVDVVISNCVINLSTDKSRVFREVHRVLKEGGRIAISDIALLRPIPKVIRESIDAYIGCVAGALLVEEYKEIVEEAGFNDVKIEIKGSLAFDYQNTNDPLIKEILDNLDDSVDSIVDTVVSVYVTGRKANGNNG